MSTPNGRTRWGLDLVIGVLIILLGYLGSRLDQRVDDVETTATAAAATAATVKIQNDTRWDEVLRRLQEIDRKLSQDEQRRGGR